MNKSESIKELAEALSKFQREVKNPTNSATNPFFKSKYAPLNDVLNLVRPILSNHGLSIVQAPSGDGENIIVTTILLHNSGEFIEFPPLILKADKATAQGAGSAITYGRRYAISAILGISSEDDDDGNGAEPEKEPKKDTSGNKPIDKQTKSLSDAQIGRLFKIGTSRGQTKDVIEKSIKKDYNKDKAEDLTRTEYDALCKRLETLPIKG